MYAVGTLPIDMKDRNSKQKGEEMVATMFFNIQAY